MRRAAILASVLTGASLLPTSAGAAADRVEVRHAAPIPCTVACSYWDAGEALGNDVCERPSPIGSYDRTLFTFTASTGIIQIRAEPDVDYDTFVCTNTVPSRLVQNWGHPIGQECRYILGRQLLAVGCVEWMDLTLNGLHAANGGVNDDFIVISYNWSDVGSVDIDLKGPVAVVDDTFNPVLV